MGYYTDFTLSIYKDKNGNEEVSEDEFDKVNVLIGKTSGYNEDGMFDGIYFHGKWYKYEDNMSTVSKKFPHLFLRLDGNGEEHGDIWTHVYHNGLKVSEWHQPEIHMSMSELTSKYRVKNSGVLINTTVDLKGIIEKLNKHIENK